MSNITPLIQQYLDIKSMHKECLLFFRMGDFYELFFEDAITTAKELSIVLTKRGKINDQDIPMCGVPHHSSMHYIKKLISSGFKIAICEQIESPEEAKKSRGYKAIVKREVIRIITPGTVIENEILESSSNNYIMSIYMENQIFYLSWLDISTGEFLFTNLSNASSIDHINRVAPKEVILSSATLNSIHHITQSISRTVYDQSMFCYKRSVQIIKDAYNVSSIPEHILKHNKGTTIAIGVLLEYICNTQKQFIYQLPLPKEYNYSFFLHMDIATQRSLDLITSSNTDSKNTLLHTIKHTKTPAGNRLLRRYILSPLLDPQAINSRLDVVELFIKQPDILSNVIERLTNIPDLERAVTRIAVNNFAPKDLHTINNFLYSILLISEILSEHLYNPRIKYIYNSMHTFPELRNFLDKSLNDEIPNNINDGNVINKNYNQSLLTLFQIQQTSENRILELTEQYRNELSIKSLKIKHNNILGYYIEIPSQHINKMHDFIHKQTLANCARFSSHELQKFELELITSKTQYLEIETQIIQQIRSAIMKHHHQLLLTSHVSAELDVLTSFSYLSQKYNFSRPIIDDSLQFTIKDGVHPIVSKFNKTFITNDIDLSDKNLMLLTGPNMAGKSTFLRQNALLIIMAQIGCFVPAKYMHIGTVDKIFTRIGASDNISQGQSTFMTEMKETSNIIHHSTSRSFIIMDEVGRGTSLLDGIAIAASIIKYIHNQINARSIFATHYHELHSLSKVMQKLSSYSMSVKEWENKIIFLYKIIPQTSNQSYGINVAKIAGLPSHIINDSQYILSKLENKKNNSFLESILLQYAKAENDEISIPSIEQEIN